MVKKLLLILFLNSIIAFSIDFTIIDVKDRPVFKIELTNNIDSNDNIEFIKVIESGNINTVKEFVTNNKLEVSNIRFSSGYTPLMLASQYGYTQIVRYFLEEGSNVNSESSNGETALLFALYNRKEVIANILLRANANVDIRTRNGYTPLIVAIEKSSSTLAKSIIDKSSKVNATSNDGVSALVLSVLLKKYDYVELLLNKRADINTVARNGYTPLMIACELEDLDMVNLLIKNKANVRLSSFGLFSRSTALSIAERKKNKQIIEALRKAGAIQ